MNQARRSLLTHTRNLGPLSLTKSYFSKASKQVSSFILVSFRKFSQLFKKPQSQIKLTNKEQSTDTKEQAQAKVDINESYKGLKLCFQNKSYEDENQLLEEKQIDFKNQQTRIYNENSPRLIENLDQSLYIQTELKNQFEKSVKMNQGINTFQETFAENQVDQLQGYIKGSKKVKTQQQIKLTKEETREVQIIINQTPQTLKHFTEIHNQVIEDIVKNQSEQSQKKELFLQMKKQAQKNFQKMRREPKKAAVKEFKEAKKLMRELVQRQADFEKRFQLRLLQKRKRTKERMKIQLVNQLKLDMILPNFDKIVAGLRQEKLRKRQQKQEQANKIAEETRQKTNVDIYQHQKKPTYQASTQGEQSKQPKTIAQIQQNVKNKPINSQLIACSQQIENERSITMPFAKQKNENQSQSQKKQETIKNSDQEKPISQDPVPIFKKQNLKQQISASLLKLGNLNKKKSQTFQSPKEITNKIQQNPFLAKTTQVFQTPNKPTNPFTIAKNTNKESNKKQLQSTLSQAEPTIQKINPFLNSTPSAKLRFEDIINKNPQFTIFNTKSPTSLTPPSSAAAQVFRPDHNLPGNLFKNACQQNYQQLQGSVQQHSNNFNFHHQQQQPQPQNHTLMENRSIFMAPNTSSTPHMNSLQPSQEQFGYHSGINADPERLRNMFQSSQPVQQSGLFSGLSSNTNASRNHSRHQGSNRHKKNRDIRIS